MRFIVAGRPGKGKIERNSSHLASCFLFSFSECCWNQDYSRLCEGRCPNQGRDTYDVFGGFSHLAFLSGSTILSSSVLLGLLVNLTQPWYPTPTSAWDQLWPPQLALLATILYVGHFRFSRSL